MTSTRSSASAAVAEERLASGEEVEHPRLVERLCEDLRAGRAIEGRLSPTHYGVPRANFARRLREVSAAEVEEDNYVFIHPSRLERFTGLLG